MASFLLDSDVLIWLLRGRTETVALAEQLQRESVTAVACSALSVLEIRTGVRSGEERKTHGLLESLRIVPVDGLVARRAAGLLSARKGRRNPREWIDALIAATCVEYRLTLVTYNLRDYPYREIFLYPTS